MNATPNIILLYLGIILFFVLLILFVIAFFKDKPTKGLLFMFIIPVVMIGWPTIRSLKITDKGFELEKLIAEAAVNPEKKAQLAQITDSLNKITINNADTIKLLAQANAALGDTLTAANKIEKALEKDSNDIEAIQLKKIYFTPSIKIQKGIESLKANPANENARHELKANLLEEEQKPEAQRIDPLQIAAANYILMDTSKSNILLQKAVEKKPELQNFNAAKAMMLKKHIMNK